MMNNKKLIEIYNESLEGILAQFKISGFNDLDKISTNDLKILFNLFSDKIGQEGVDSKGNITVLGAAIDEIAGKINDVILSRK